MLSVDEQMKIIKKGVDEIIDETELALKLEYSIKKQKPLIIKLGLDPSAPDIHLGHAVVLRKIKQLQDLGHKAIIIIGDFTGRIGDPTGKSKTRNQLTEKEVLKNADTYKQQIDRILDPKKTTILFNSEWLGRLTLVELIELTSKHTLARMLEREDFKNRFNRRQSIGIHELFYPILQGYDSLEIDADIELGGSDQRFNILMGRDMQNKEGKEKQIAIFMPLLEGTDGSEKMSKSLGNYIGISESAIIQYEKVMQIPDSLIVKYFELATDIHPDKILQINQDLEQSIIHPKEVKMNLATEIVTLYHGANEATKAREHFVKVFSKGRAPDKMPIVNYTNNDTIVDIMLKSHMVESKSEARRLISQSGVKLNNTIITNFNQGDFNNGDIVKIGKKKFIKISKSLYN